MLYMSLGLGRKTYNFWDNFYNNGNDSNTTFLGP